MLVGLAIMFETRDVNMFIVLKQCCFFKYLVLERGGVDLSEPRKFAL